MDALVRSYALFKSFLKRWFTFLICVKMITVISKLLNFSLSHTHTRTDKYSNFAFSSWWSWETQGSTIDSMYGLSLLSRSPQDSIDKTVSKSFISSSVYIRTAKISYSKKYVFHQTPSCCSKANFVLQFFHI